MIKIDRILAPSRTALQSPERDVWPAGRVWGALGVSRGGFYAWLTRARGRRR